MKRRTEVSTAGYECSEKKIKDSKEFTVDMRIQRAIADVLIN